MNILHVVNVFFVVPFFFGDQFKYFKKKGHNIFLVCSPSDQLKDQSILQGFNYVEIPIQKKISIFQDLKSTFYIYRYIKKQKIDIVNGHTPKGALLAILAAYIARVPRRVYFRHGLVFETAKGLKRFILITMDRLTGLLATQIINVSPSVAQKSIEYKLNKASKQKLLLKGTCSGIDLNKFNSENIDQNSINSLRLLLNLPTESFVVGFMGRLVRDKGITELVESFKILSSKYENIYLLLVGMAEERDALPLFVIDEIKNNPKIINTGYIHNSEIANYYSLMDVYILPSYREGFPTSVLEASAMKLPVITTKVTGCIDSVLDGQTGIFVDNTSESIVQAIEFCINNRSVIRQYGINGREFVTQNFEQELIWKEIETQLYHQ